MTKDQLELHITIRLCLGQGWDHLKFEGVGSATVRAVVHKLRLEGMPIVSCTRRGYKFADDPSELYECAARLMRRIQKQRDAADAVFEAAEGMRLAHEHERREREVVPA